MNKKKSIPELRFSEFIYDGNWEERFIEEFFAVGSSKRVLQEDWTNKGVPFYRTRELVSLSKNEPFGSEIFISEELFSEISEKYGIPSEGDFLVSGVGTLGICYQVKASDRFYFKDGNVLWFKLEKGINSTYFKFCFQSDYIQNQIVKQASISTVGTYTIQNSKKTTLWYPPTQKEQQKIASCLSSLDEVIAAHSQKLEALKDHKKGLMQNLFPQEGETVPKWRFKEFENDWEKVKLKDVSSYFNGGSYENDVKEEGKYELITLKSIDTSGKLVNSKRYINIEVPTLTKDTLIMILSEQAPGLLGMTAIIPTENKYVLNQRIAEIRPNQKVESFFLSMAINRNQVYFSKQGAGMKVQNITKPNVENYEFLIPEIPEQQKIASCLFTLDELIAAQSEKIEQLKLHKKGLMQGLFPVVETLHATSLPSAFQPSAFQPSASQ